MEGERKIMWRSRKARYLVLTGLCFYLIALANDALPMYVLCWATLSLVVAAFMLARLGLSGLAGERRLPRLRVFPDEPVAAALSLHNRGSFPKSNLLLRDEWRNLTLHQDSQRTRLLSWLGGEEATQVEIPTKLPHRGHYRLGPVTAIAMDPLGIFEARRCLQDTEKTVVVYPRPVPLPHFRLPAAWQHDWQPERHRYPRDDGLEFHSIREYQEGDDLRRVHWKTTAHMGRLYIREFEQETAAVATVVLDLHREQVFGSGFSSSLETAIVAAASVSQRLLELGYRLRFLAYEKFPVDLGPGQGQEHWYRILEVLAVAEGKGQVPLAALLNQHLPTLTCSLPLVVITGTTAPEAAAVLAHLRQANQWIVLVGLAGHTFLPPVEDLASEAGGKLLSLRQRLRQFLRIKAEREIKVRERTAKGRAGPEGRRELQEAVEAFWTRLRTSGVAVLPVGAGADLTASIRWEA